MKFLVPALKPRNPLVAAARARHGGSHRSTAGAQRRQADRALQRELDQMKQSP